MIIVVLLVWPVSVHAAYGDWCWTQECRDEAEEDKQLMREILLGVIVVACVYAVISSASSAEQKETELMSKWVPQLLKDKPHEWIDPNGKLIVFKW